MNRICDYCGNEFNPDKRGACSACGGRPSETEQQQTNISFGMVMLKGISAEQFQKAVKKAIKKDFHNTVYLSSKKSPKPESTTSPLEIDR